MSKATELSVMLRRQREECGFFNSVPFLSHACSIPASGGLTVRYCLSEDVFNWGAVCEGRKLDALLLDAGDPVPFAVMEATVLSKGGGHGLGISESCDLLSESLNKVVNELSRTSVEDLLSVISEGGVLILNRLEVRSKFNHLGLGRRLFFTLIEHVNKSLALSLFAFHPFPLQYEYCEPTPDSQDYELFWESFRIDVDKLSNYYCYEFGCKSVSPETNLLINSFSGWQLNIDRFGWSVEISESSC
ncbi:hypothetical protein K5D56_25545 [Pseudomonas cichorii]|nr:hypothetical protein [Pseudomonas cichorii]MBX8556984.1 hypothetical protein [Pseudomonas cichorii]MBX8592741.1 hypothetical protein [Pseudomonas cichorii]